MKLFYDNKVMINIANTPVQHDRTKHIEIGRHFIKEKLGNETVCSSYKLAGCWYIHKAPTKAKFEYFVSKLGMIDIYAPTWGEVLEI